LDELTVLIDFVLPLEVSEQYLSEELFLVESQAVSELLFGHSVHYIVEDLLVSMVDEFVLEHTLALMSPKEDQEEFLSDLLLQVQAALDDVELWLLGDSADALEHSGQLSDVEGVMELQWSRQYTSLHLLPQCDGGVNEDVLHVDHLLGILLRVEEHFKDLTIDVLN
jgi:hypothetical protein